MSRLVGELLGQLDDIRHRADEDELRKLLIRWQGKSGASLIRQALRQWLASSASHDQIKAAARETSTHYVWPLHASDSGYCLVINEFKDPRQMAKGYANTIHDHRYSFASLVLSGGYRQMRSRVDISRSGQLAHIEEIGQDEMSEGSILAVNYNEFHRLTEIGSRTVTLVVKCPPAKEVSISVDIGTKRISKHVPVEARIALLMSSLIRVGDTGMVEGEADARFA